MNEFIKNIGYGVILIGIIGFFSIFLLKPEVVSGYFDPIVYYSNVEYIQTGKKECKNVKAGNHQEKLVKVDCSIFSRMQLKKMEWKPAY